jgi:hypothetical protein
MREEAEHISQFLLGLYAHAAASSPDEFRRQTLRRLGGLIAFDFALWGGGRADDRQVSDLTALGQTPRVPEDWSAVADTDAFCDITLNRLGQTARFDDVENYRRTPAYNKHWKRFGARQMMATIAAEPQDGYVSFVGLCADTKTAIFSDTARRLKLALTRASAPPCLSPTALAFFSHSRRWGIWPIHAEGACLILPFDAPQADRSRRQSVLRLRSRPG